MERKAKSRPARNKKPKAKPGLKNRYMRSSKISEYKFLQILKGFSDNLSTKELAENVRVSEKSIRAIYRSLRDKLIEAVVVNQHDFNEAGFYLLRSGKMDEKGKRFLAGVAESELFTEHVEKHAPRLHSPDDLQTLLFEVSVRVFCNMKLKEGALIDFPDETKVALREMRDIADWIKQNLDNEEFMTKYGHVIERFQKLSQDMKLLLEKEQLLAMKNQSKAHHYPWDLLYTDLRRHLLKHPI